MQSNLLELLSYIDPSTLDYQEWLSVGMALHHEGHGVEEWGAWSQRDPRRYHAGECERKWRGFCGNPHPVTGGTIGQMAKDRGWIPQKTSHELGWDDAINDPKATKERQKGEIQEPEKWEPERQLITYLETLFDADDKVGYVTQTWSKPGSEEKYPDKGCWDRTAQQLIQKLSECKGDIGSVLGDYDPEAGAWIRFNPLDGDGCRNENVTKFKYALVESDEASISTQLATIKELELPVACLVHSGGKSLHAIVRVDAPSYEEYRKRVNYLYKMCEENGLPVDRQNKNPSRLSRMPGVTRGGKKQYLLAANMGKASWDEWQEWARESIDDDLPKVEGLADAWGDMPDLAPCLIEGVLRMGHKMLISGPSKAGKSFLQIGLCISIAEGRPWLGFKCAQGAIMYVNLELDRASCLHRFRDVYKALGWEAANLPNIDI